LSRLKEKTKGKRLLDVGCGMGFIINIAKDYFSFIRGIDITPAMLEKADKISKDKCDIAVSFAKAEEIPFEAGSFDACTCYNVLHHLKSAEAAIKEMCRVLKPGGMLFTGLDPNFYFWNAFSKLDPKGDYPPPVRREIDAVLNKADELEKKYKIPKETIVTAMRCKYVDRGFKPGNLAGSLKRAGFSKYKIEYAWYAGQAKIINDRKNARYAPVIDNYLREMLPLSRHLFKYLNIIAVK
jgi:ubiquinone/menaquinone biosynthesis C-methylase UbiE